MEAAELRDRVVVAEEERDAARDKEEEYFREVNDRDEQINRMEEGCVWAWSFVAVQRNGAEWEITGRADQPHGGRVRVVL